MSASSSSDSDRKEKSITEEGSFQLSRYAVYIFSTNKHASGSENINNSGVEDRNTLNYDSKSDSEELNICLSLLDGNVEAEQETVVRCYLLKTLSAKEDISFESEGKCATLKFSDDSGGLFGCYYHRLSKPAGNVVASSPKKYIFFICLIGSTGIIESFCPELGKFCYKLVPLLDPEGLKNQNDVEQKLQMWHYYCVEYLERCVQSFKEEIAILLQSSLWGNVNIICEDENVKWDLERLVETCSLITMMSKENQTLQERLESLPIAKSDDYSLIIDLDVQNEKIVPNKDIGSSSYCMKWVNQLLSCKTKDHIGLKSILEDFRLKTVQELNTLKRLLQKAENDQYALYRAYRFLQASSYEAVLLHHATHEAQAMHSDRVLDLIRCLTEFMQDTAHTRHGFMTEPP